MDYTAGLPTERMAAAVLFFDDSDRLLLVEPAAGCRARAEGRTSYLEDGHAAS